jgi:phosphoribulokinase
MAEAQSKDEMHFSHFGPEANLFEELETLFRVYGESGTGKARKYLHQEEEAAPYQTEGRHVYAVGGHPVRHGHALL